MFPFHVSSAQLLCEERASTVPQSPPPFVIFGTPPISPYPRKDKQEKGFFVLEKVHRPEKDVLPTAGGMIVTNSRNEGNTVIMVFPTHTTQTEKGAVFFKAVDNTVQAMKAYQIC